MNKNKSDFFYFFFVGRENWKKEPVPVRANAVVVKKKH